MNRSNIRMVGTRLYNKRWSVYDRETFGRPTINTCVLYETYDREFVNEWGCYEFAGRQDLEKLFAWYGYGYGRSTWGH